MNEDFRTFPQRREILPHSGRGSADVVAPDGDPTTI
jgi:hypothetical protein